MPEIAWLWLNDLEMMAFCFLVMEIWHLED
jgi:hypothetical protein